MLKKILILCTFILFSDITLSQSFGFGCLGFVGGYGGYSYQTYSPKGLNDFAGSFNLGNAISDDAKLEDFGTATGYRVGINLFRGNFPLFFITAKGFYQSVAEDQSFTDDSPGASDYNYDLKIRNWGIGLDVGIPVTSDLSWKILDAALLFNMVKLTSTENGPGFTRVIKYESEGTNLGYSFGTGFIYSIINDYISIEALAAYTFMTVDKLKNPELGYFQTQSSDQSDFIDGGGFTAVLQLNVGFPL